MIKMTQLEKLKTAVEKDNKAQAVQIVPDLVREFRRRRTHEDVQTKIAKVLSRIASEEENSGLPSEYLQATARTSEARTKVNSGLFRYLSDEATASETLDTVDDALSKREQVRQKGRRLVAAKDELDGFPAIVVLYGQDELEIPKDGSIGTNYTVENVGNTPKKNLDIEVESSELDVQSNPGSIAELNPEEIESVSLSIPGGVRKEGVFSITLSVRTAPEEETEEGGIEDTLDVSLVVIDKSGYIDRAISQTRALSEELDDIRTDTTGRNQGLMKKLETIEKRLKDIKKKIDAGSQSEGKGRGRSGGPPGEAIDNQIDSIINQYDAFINQVEGLQKADKISEFRSVLFTQDAGDVIETLEKAKKAEV